MRAYPSAPIRATLGAELDKTLNGRLKHLSEEDRKALGVMLEAAANKILHAPTRILKQATDKPEGSALIDAARKLFELEDHPTTDDKKDEATQRH